MSSQDAFKFECPNCSVNYKTVVANVGKRFRCKKCEHKFVVEQPQTEIETVATDFDFETDDIDKIIKRNQAVEAEQAQLEKQASDLAATQTPQPADPKKPESRAQKLERRRQAELGKKPPKRIFNKKKKSDNASAAPSNHQQSDHDSSGSTSDLETPEDPLLLPGPLPETDDDADGDDLLATAGNVGEVEPEAPEEEDLSPLQIDGLTNDSVDVSDLYGLKCNVCDTRIHVTDDQVGTQVDCPICFTKVMVTPPRKKPSQRPTWMSPEDYYDKQDSDDDLKLADPVEILESANVTPTYSIEEVEDDLPVVEPESPSAPAEGLALVPDEPEVKSASTPPEPAQTTEPESPAGARGFELEPVDTLDEITADDLQGEGAPEKRVVDHQDEPDSSAESNEEVVSKPAAVPPVVAPKRKQRARNNSLPQESVQARSTKEGVMSRRERLENALEDEEEPEQPLSVHESEDLDPLTLGSMKEHVVGMFKSPMLWAMIAVSAILMTFGDMFYDAFSSVSAQEGEERKNLGHPFKLVMYGIGYAGMFLAGTFVLWYASSVIFRESARGSDVVSSWKSQGSNEFLSTFLLFGFSFFLAGSFLLPLGTAASLPLRILLSPLLLVVAWYSQNAFIGIDFTPLKTLRTQGANWQSFFTFAIILAVIGCVGGVFFWVPYCSIIGAIIICITTVAFAAGCGWHVGRTVKLMEVGSEE